MEDVLLYDTDLKAHVGRVREVIRQCSEHEITLHPGKFVCGMPAVSYCGFKLSADGYQLDDHLVKALHSFPVPTNRTEPPCPAIPGLLAEPDSHARPHSVVAVAKFNIRLGDTTPLGFPTSDPGTHQTKDPGQLQTEIPSAAGDRRSPIKGSWPGLLAAAALRRVANPPMRLSPRHPSRVPILSNRGGTAKGRVGDLQSPPVLDRHRLRACGGPPTSDTHPQLQDRSRAALSSFGRFEGETGPLPGHCSVAV